MGFASKVTFNSSPGYLVRFGSWEFVDRHCLFKNNEPRGHMNSARNSLALRSTNQHSKLFS